MGKRDDGQDAIGPKLAAAARREQIAENARWVEVRSHGGDAEDQLLGRVAGGAVPDGHRRVVLQGLDSRRDQVRPRVALPDAHVPQITRRDRREDPEHAGEHGAEGGHVGVGAVGVARGMPNASQSAPRRWLGSAKARRESVSVSR